MRYHYLITVQASKRSGGTMCGTTDDIVDASPGQSRQEVFYEIFQKMCRKLGVHPGDASVLFFSLEPNDLVR